MSGNIGKELSNFIKSSKEHKKENATPIDRLRPGQKPKFVRNESDESENSDNEEVKGKINPQINISREVINEIENTDRRVKRLLLAKEKKTELNDKDSIIQKRLQLRREIYKSEIIDENNNQSNNNEMINAKPEFEDVETKRRKLKEKLIFEAEQEENEDELLEMLGESENKNEDLENKNSENENDDSEAEEEEYLMRPVFVSKEQRITINEQLTKEQEELLLHEQQEKAKTLKIQETDKLVQNYIKDEEKELEKDCENQPMIDDTDDMDNLEEYEQWKLRELKRIKKTAEEDELKLKEKLEIDRRRNLTDEQRKDENLRLGSDDTLRPFKSKYQYLQKYYHKGAFFQNDSQANLDHIFNRDYNLPTVDETFDKSTLPAFMQKKRLFKKGASKYTHLTAEDTTNFDPMFKTPEFIAQKVMNSIGGYKAKDVFDVSARKKK